MKGRKSQPGFGKTMQPGRGAQDSMNNAGAGNFALTIGVGGKGDNKTVQFLQDQGPQVPKMSPE